MGDTQDQAALPEEKPMKNKKANDQEQRVVEESQESQEPQESSKDMKDLAGSISSPPLSAKQEINEFFRTALIAVLLAVLIRSFWVEPFNIPSGSMKPTLLVGDYLFVNKPAYGYSRYSFPFGIAPIEGRLNAKEPQRGDVIVFKLPSNPSIDYIKRIVALPGETVQVRKGRLYINGKEVEREFVKLMKDEKNGSSSRLIHYIETLPGDIIHDIYEVSDEELMDDTQLFVVPQGHYFVMGDNRDNSQDSRVSNNVGFVPFENIVGRADFVFFSANGEVGLFEFWAWPWGIRYERFMYDIDPIRPAVQ